MDINRDNYEAWFLDYAEGNLAAAERDSVDRFLKSNPDLCAELEAFSIYPLERSAISYPDKEALKRSFPLAGDRVSEQQFDMFCIAYLEGDLSLEQRVSYEAFLSANPDFQSRHDSFRSVYLTDEKIVYPNKGMLKRRKPILIQWKIIAPLAAAAVLLAMLLIGPAEQNEQSEFAVLEEESSQGYNLSENESASTEKQEQFPGQDNQKEEKTEKTEKKESRAAASSSQSTLKVIRGSKAPVPETDYNKKQGVQKMENSVQQAEKNTRIAGLNLKPARIEVVEPSYDQIVFHAIKTPEVHPGSLSALNLARYQYQKASEAMEEEDVLLWNLASSGIKELNKLTGNNVQLLASKDEKGAISGIQFKSRILSITTPISKDDE